MQKRKRQPKKEKTLPLWVKCPKCKEIIYIKEVIPLKYLKEK